MVIGIGAYVLVRTPDSVDLETRKIRFAAATFTGILMLFVFSIILRFVDETGAGKEIFDKTITAISTLAGAIIGYFFSLKGGQGRAGKKDEQGKQDEKEKGTGS